MLYNRHFSHIYIEKDAATHPNTALILKHFPKSVIVQIDHYKEIFNRPRQSFHDQKESKSLILAVRKEDFLYPGAEPCDPMGHKHFFYNTLVMNCPFECNYCYLQGLYQTANIVLFVNVEDYLKAASEALASLSSLYLAVSYDTDLLALNGVFPYARHFMELARNHPSLTIEIRTKTALTEPFSEISPLPNVILAWTISPAVVSEAFEHGAPAPEHRIKAAAKAASLGWPVRICIDPIIRIPGWRQHYQALSKEITTQIPRDRIRDFSIGTFRMNETFAKSILKRRPDESLFSETVTEKNMRCYPTDISEEMVRTVRGFFAD